ncbi:MAG: hypothetical protein KJ070_20380 [Verrucomicrobia bacterium]|nr:hypothetical protein [Verrucomicrobiota bacterium]
MPSAERGRGGRSATTTTNQKQQMRPGVAREHRFSNRPVADWKVGGPRHGVAGQESAALADWKSAIRQTGSLRYGVAAVTLTKKIEMHAESVLTHG